MPDSNTQDVVFQGIHVINEVPTLDEGIPLTEDTKMYLDIEKTFRQIPLSRLLDWLKGQLTKIIYPIGSVYMTFDATNPSSLFGGTWEKVEDRFLLGSGTETLGATGGSATHTLTVDELPTHSHGGSVNESGSHTHEITINNAGSHNHTPATNHMFTTNSTVNDGPDVAITGRRRVQTNTGNIWAMTSLKADEIYESQYTSTDGSHTHTASVSSNGNHDHTVSISSTGNGQAFDTMPPYTVVNIWRRIA